MIVVLQTLNSRKYSRIKVIVFPFQSILENIEGMSDIFEKRTHFDTALDFEGAHDIPKLRCFIESVLRAIDFRFKIFYSILDVFQRIQKHRYVLTIRR